MNNLPLRIDELEKFENKASVSSVAKRIAETCSNDALNHISYEQAQAYEILPVSIRDDYGDILVTGVYSKNFILEHQKNLEFALGVKVCGEIIEDALLKESIEIAYRASSNWLTTCAREVGAELPLPVKREESVIVSEGSIPKLLSAIINRGINLKASDVHIEGKDSELFLRYRVDGELIRETSNLEIGAIGSISRRIRVLSEVDTTSKNRIIDCSFSFNYLELDYRIRASLIPLVCSEKIVLRILKPSQVAEELSYSQIGFDKSQEELFRSAIRRRNGTILLSGPTGSGKTTLLYKALSELNKSEKNICTIEDPVERIIPGLSQSQVNKENFLGFYELLVSILRQDPDIIMLGEIREKITAISALTAGLTGHLVFSTVHAANSIEVFSRLTQLGVDPQLLSQALSLVVSQRLIPKNCPNCIEEVDVAEEMRSFFVIADQIRFCHSKGCIDCHNTGNLGRVGVFEFFSVSNYVRDVIEGVEVENVDDTINMSNSFSSRLRRAGLSSGYQPYQLKIRELLCDGVISPAQAMSYI